MKMTKTNETQNHDHIYIFLAKEPEVEIPIMSQEALRSIRDEIERIIKK